MRWNFWRIQGHCSLLGGVHHHDRQGAAVLEELPAEWQFLEDFHSQLLRSSDYIYDKEMKKEPINPSGPKR
jgi:hypothetical protein